MVESLLDPRIREFIESNLDADENSLLLQHQELHNVPMSLIVNQIIGKRKARTKIPLYFNTPSIIYPPAKNLEQASSEIVAQFKFEILKSEFVQNGHAADLTGGFGIDTFFLSKCFTSVHYVDIQKSLLDIAQHNHSTLKSAPITYHLSTAEEFLAHITMHLDLVYIDPDRRPSQRKTVTLTDSVPNLLSMLDRIFEVTGLLVIKLSPLMDIHLLTTQIAHIKKLLIISVDNDCKELICLCEKNYSGKFPIACYNLTKNGQQSFIFYPDQERLTEIAYSEPLTFIYEPNATILKGGAFKLIGKEYNLAKIHPNTHLYTSDSHVHGFPGRIFRVLENLKPQYRMIKKCLPAMKAHIITRNYPLTVDLLRKKIKVQEGGEKYLLGFSSYLTKHLLLTERVD